MTSRSCHTYNAWDTRDTSRASVLLDYSYGYLSVSTKEVRHLCFTVFSGFNYIIFFLHRAVIRRKVGWQTRMMKYSPVGLLTSHCNDRTVLSPSQNTTHSIHVHIVSYTSFYKSVMFRVGHLLITPCPLLEGDSHMFVALYFCLEII